MADDKDKATNNDAGKRPWQYFPWDAAAEVVDVMERAISSGEYEPRNWEKGLEWSRQFASIQRHLLDWFQGGQDRDPKTGLLNLAHVGARVLYLLAYQIREIGDDDRPGSN